MTDQLETLQPDVKIDDLLGVFDRGRVAIVMDGDKFLGLITQKRSPFLSAPAHAEVAGRARV